MDGDAKDVKHIIIFCPDRAHNRQKLYEEAGTNRYHGILSTGKGLRAVARWVMNEGLSTQFSLAKEHIDLLEGRTSTGGDGNGDGSENGDGGEDGDGDDEDESAEQE